MHEDEDAPVRRGVDFFPNVVDKPLPFQFVDVEDIQFLVGKPVGRIDDHAEAQAGLDPRVE